MKDVKKVLAKNIKKAREELGCTQSEIAERMEMERSAYSQYESGRNLIPLNRLFQLSEILKKPVYVLLELSLGELTADEVEILELYRSLPETGPARKFARRSIWALIVSANEIDRGATDA